MLLRELVEANHVLFLDSADSWEESIRLSCQPLVADGTVADDYAEEIIECVKKHGPYIVLIPGFAMPHSMQGSQRAARTGLSFMKLKTPVSFEPGDPEKNASVFFTLAAVDENAHLENMQKLFQTLSNEALCAELLTVSSPADLLRLDVKYSSTV